MKLNLPSNIRNEELDFFESSRNHLEHIPQIILLENVWVTKPGIIFKGIGIVKESVHQYKGRQRSFWKRGLYHRFFKKKKYLTTKETSYTIIHNSWSWGYFHWVAESLPRLWAIRDKDFILLMPEEFKNKFQEQFLKIFNPNLNIQWYSNNVVLKVPRLLLAENTPFTGMFHQETLKSLRAHFLKNLNIEEGEEKIKIYISRKKAKTRFIQNEEDLEAYLISKGFLVLCMEDFSVSEQIKLFSKTIFLISIHGAGLSNCIFMPEGSSVLEFQPNKTNFNPLYYKMSVVMGHKYYYQKCIMENESDSIYNANLIVDIFKLESIF